MKFLYFSLTFFFKSLKALQTSKTSLFPDKLFDGISPLNENKIGKFILTVNFIRDTTSSDNPCKTLLFDKPDWQKYICSPRYLFHFFETWWLCTLSISQAWNKTYLRTDKQTKFVITRHV